MSSDIPKNLDELFKFYYDFVKPLYSQVQTQNKLPFETLFELNAAFDHISRHWYYGEPEEEAIEKAYGHLKRSCLDIFKLRVKEARKQFEELREVDTSVIDNGEFDNKLISLFSNLTEEAQKAREKEGEYRTTNEQEHAFELWQPVLDKCVTLEQDYYNNSNVDWAKQRQLRISKKNFAFSILAAFIGGLLVNFIFSLLL